ncbi:hypothetical protein B0H10DRAFT_2023108, partial [Mycena sp. CBHHK59/15]
MSFNLRTILTIPDPPALCSSTHSPTMDIDGPERMFFVPQIYFCSDIYAQPGNGAEASSSRDTLPSLPQKTSLSILRDIFLGHHATRSRISIFHSDLPTIKTALELHSIPSHIYYENDADHIAHIHLPYLHERLKVLDK